MENNIENLGQQNQETRATSETQKKQASDSSVKKMKLIKAVVGIVVILLVIIGAVYAVNNNATNQGITDPQNVEVVYSDITYPVDQASQDTFLQEFTNEEPVLTSETPIPDDIRERFEASLLESQEQVKTLETNEDGEQFAAYINVANMHKSLGNYPAALQAYKDALTLFPDDELLWHNLGVLFEEMHLYTEAAKAYESSIVKTPYELNAHLRLASLYDQHSSNPTKAREVYERALTLTEDNLNTIKAYAAYLERVQDYAASLQEWKKLIDTPFYDSAIERTIERLEQKVQ